jgi:glycyl-tRNA synthetase (class II)
MTPLARSCTHRTTPTSRTCFDAAAVRASSHHDEIGTPFAVTIDHQTHEDRTITVRDRDSLEQGRIAIDELADELKRPRRVPWRSPKVATDGSTA